MLSRKIAPAADGQGRPTAAAGPAGVFPPGRGRDHTHGCASTPPQCAVHAARATRCHRNVMTHGQKGFEAAGAFPDAIAARRRPGRASGLHSLAAALFMAVTVLHAVAFKARCARSACFTQERLPFRLPLARSHFPRPAPHLNTTQIQRPHYTMPCLRAVMSIVAAVAAADTAARAAHSDLTHRIARTRRTHAGCSCRPRCASARTPPCTAWCCWSARRSARCPWRC